MEKLHTLKVCGSDIKVTIYISIYVRTFECADCGDVDDKSAWQENGSPTPYFELNVKSQSA